MAVKDARSVRAAQRSKILDGHRSGGYALQRALSTSRNSLPRGAPFYNEWAKSSLARSGSASKGGKTGEKERSLRRQTPFGMLGTLKVMQLWSSWLPWAAPVLAVAS